jgi:hypothetical protein
MNASGRWISKGLPIGAAILVVAVLVLSMVLTSQLAVSALPLGSNTSPTAPVASTTSTAAAPVTSNPTSSQSPSGHAEAYYANPQTSGGPHPGTLEGYEIAPSGMTSEDPAVAYDTVSFEPILNVYQTLISYNGSSTSNFVPEVSSCVPGTPSDGLSTPSVSCEDIYGQSLITDNSLGEPQYWTFPIGNASFYDPSTGAHWQVYPSDVMFSLARTMSFADLPGPGVLNGWIQTQSLTPTGNPTWDGAIHFPFNNTPNNIMASMLINDSTYCPAAALAQFGCITFDAYGGATDWPFFLELVADPLGAGVVPCGWFTYVGAGVPGWSGTAQAKGDGPCLLPGKATSTSQPAFTSYLSSLSPTSWDSFQELALNHPAVQNGVRFSLVGSGPYYAAVVGQTTGYTLQANPYYVQPSNCAGVGGGCQPAAGSYIGKVVITYESTSTEGLQQYEAGQADFAEFFPSDTGSILQLQSEGAIGVLKSPTISTFFLPFDLNFSVTAEAAIDPNAGQLNVKGNFFASNTVRNLLSHAYPYTTILNTVWTVDGVAYARNFGGAIPIGMGNYYPTNVSFPYLGGDPCTGSTQSTCNDSVNSALWWWQQGTTSSSPYYDSELAACTSSSPCSFPIIGELGNPGLDAAIVDYINALGIITDGAIVPYSFDLSFPDLVEYSAIGDGQNPMPFYNLGWAPDYPDPTDYMAAMYYANGTYTFGDGTYQVLETQAQYNQASCGHNTGSWSDLVYWANYMQTQGGPIPNGCQGPAYGAMLDWMAIAASQAPGAYRILIYNEVEHIENQLSFYVWYQEENGVGSSAKWINNATINTNVMIGGGGDQTFYLWQYTTATTNVWFNETGLSSVPTTGWTVRYAGVTYTNSSLTPTSVLIPSQTNGTYQWSIGYQQGYTVATTSPTTTGNGSLTVLVTPGLHGITVTVTFTGYTCPPCGSLAISQEGLVTGTDWTVIVETLGSLTTNGTDPIFLGVATGTYTYYALPSIGYTIPTGASGSLTLSHNGQTAAATVTYSGISFSTYRVNFNEVGLPAGATWNISMNGFTATNTTVTGPPVAGISSFYEVNATYTFTITSPSGWTSISPYGSAIVNGAVLNITVYFTNAPNPLTITEKGLAPGAGIYWGVTVALTPNAAGGAVDGFTFIGNTTSFVLNVTAGVWNYTAIPVPSGGWSTSDPSGNATVPTPGTASIRFDLVTYAQTIFEVGLPTGGLWNAYATYTFPGATVPPADPNGTGAATAGSAATTLVLNLPNGTSPYYVTGSGGEVSNCPNYAAGCSMTITAAAGFYVATFIVPKQNYTVTFSQTGVPTGGLWGVNVNGVYTNGTGSSVSASLQNGTYTYVYIVPSGYTASPAGGQLVVNGANVPVSVKVAPTPTATTSNSGLSTLAYELIGLFVALAVIFLITTVYFARRRPPTSKPPESWQSSETEEKSSTSTSTESTGDESSPPSS